MIPAVTAEHRLDTDFIESVQAFLRSFRQIAPVPGMAADVLSQAAQVLFLTSLFAAALAFHNVVWRLP